MDQIFCIQKRIYIKKEVIKKQELQQKGFMIRPGTRVFKMCQDVIPIVAFKNQVKAAKEAALPPPPPKKWYQKLNPFQK